jgi:CO dehydrogenase/acetyl-CoA synthase epsilon subunit
MSRSRILQEMAQTFRYLAQKFNIALILTNHMTTTILKRDLDEKSIMVPALGF